MDIDETTELIHGSRLLRLTVRCRHDGWGTQPHDHRCERDVRNRYVNPFPLANFAAMPEDLQALSGTGKAPNWQPARVPALTWKGPDGLRSLTPLPLVLKGIRTAEDARPLGAPLTSR
jgi:isopentenyl diphosphate isomerase/L-lactate dehydrogenase-like FMN-dependent dehydrogenase